MTDYISRVYPVSEFAWTSAQSNGDLIAEVNFPDVFYAFRGIQEKLSRFKYMRASINISIRINGTSFHYGKLIAAWSPCPVQDTSEQTLSDLTNNLVSVSGFPHVIVSAGMNEVVGLKIPFVYPYNYLDITEANAAKTPQCKLFVYVLNKLRCSDVVPPVNVTIFANLYDVTLCGYCNELPQAITFPRTRYIVPEFKSHNFRPKVREVVDGGVAQIEYMCINNPAEANVSKHKPTLLAVGNVPSSSKVDAEMEDYLCPTDLREIASRPGLLGNFTMSGFESKGTTLYTIDVHPCVGTFKPYANGEMDFMTPLRYVSWPCKYWSGSIKYKLQIISSNFHSGRIQILYTPSNTSLGGSTDTDTAFELTSHVVDIQCDSEIEFEIPWNSHLPVLSMNKEIITTNNCNGVIAIRVLNELTYKETPTPDIEFNIWVSAGSDFKLYNMQNSIVFDLTKPSVVANGGVAQIADTSRSGATGNAENLVPFVMGNHVDVPSAVEECNLMDAINTSAPVVFVDKNEQFMEPVLRPINSGLSSTNFSTNYNTGSFLQMNTPAVQYNTLICPYYDWYNLLFRFRRGGYVYSAYSFSVDDPATARLTPSTLIASAGVGSVGNFASRFRVVTRTPKQILSSLTLPSAISTRASLQPLHVQVPYSSNTKLAITASSVLSTQVVYPGLNECAIVSILAQNSQMLVFRSAAPDMKFYFQIGPPAVFKSNI